MSNKMEFHHIGIATNNIEESITKLKKFFDVSNVSEVVYDVNQDASLCMVTLVDGIKIELINGQVVKNILKKRQYLYHTCYLVENIDEEIKELEDDGAVLVKEPKEAILFNNKKVAFLMWNLGLIELINCRGGGYIIMYMLIM